MGLKLTDFNLISIIFAITPVTIIFLLLVVHRTQADMAGIIGWLVTVIIVWLYFKS